VSKHAHLETGQWGERTAEKYLRRLGYKILGRRVRFGPREEIDLVARLDNALIFIEVKTRASEHFGRPAAAVDASKRRLLSRAAVRYLARRNFKPSYIRFDVVEVIGRAGDTRPDVRHIENAFQLDRRYQLPM